MWWQKLMIKSIIYKMIVMIRKNQKFKIIIFFNFHWFPWFSLNILIYIFSKIQTNGIGKQRKREKGNKRTWKDHGKVKTIRVKNQRLILSHWLMADHV